MIPVAGRDRRFPVFRCLLKEKIRAVWEEFEEWADSLDDQVKGAGPDEELNTVLAVDLDMVDEGDQLGVDSF